MKFYLKLELLFLLVFNVSFSQKNTVQLLSPHESLKIGGKMMFDNAYFIESNKLSNAYTDKQAKSGEQFRRIFLYVKGGLYSNIEYKLQLNFINKQIGLRDAYIGIKNVPFIGTIRVGQVKEPMRLDVLNSSSYLTFMERSFNTDFMPIRNSGVLLMNNYVQNRLSYQLGVFRNSDSNTGNDKIADDSFVITTRLTGMPIAKNNQFLHVGIAGSYRKYDDRLYNVNIKPEVNLSAISYLSISGLTDVKHVNIYNSEMAYGYKSFNLQGEYMCADVYSEAQITNLFYTYYGQASWFITGEHKSVKNSYSMFNRISPKHNLNDSYSGAWELALRYSYVNLNSHAIKEGSQKDVTIGVNWYLNPYVRFMFNEVYADVADKGEVLVSQVRVQVDF
ncbi:OprO/OprP family phosphate-selective porin [Wenyingzhuangia sp. IMCC45467]